MLKLFFIFLNLLIYLFISGCAGSSPLCEGLPQLWRAGATLHRCARASHHHGLSCWEHRLQTRRLSSCGSRAQLLRGMWDPPRPGLEPVSPALAGRLPTTAPPGKPRNYFICWFDLLIVSFYSNYFPGQIPEMNMLSLNIQ